MLREKLEREVTFYRTEDTSIHGLSGWDYDRNTVIGTVKALVKDNNALLYGGSIEVNLQRIVVSMRNSEGQKVNTVALNDIVEYDGKLYTVVETDFRGILPGGYGCRVVGTLENGR